MVLSACAGKEGSALNAIKQLFRMPFKTLCGVLLVSLGTAVLSVCLSQSLAAKSTQTSLQYKFTTVALPTSNWNFKPLQSGGFGFLDHMNDEMAAWIDEKISEHPELVETVSNPGLATAYIPGLCVDNYSQYDYRRYYKSTSVNANTLMLPGNTHISYLSGYSTAVLVVTLEEVGEIVEQTGTLTLTNGERVPNTVGATVILKARIDEVLSLEAGFTDPTGWPIELELHTDYGHEIEDINLTVGQRYIVYGMDYFDNSMLFYDYLRQQVALSNELGGMNLPSFDKDLIHFLTEEEKTSYCLVNETDVAPEAIYGDLSSISTPMKKVWNETIHGYILDHGNSIQVFQRVDSLADYKTASMTLCNPATEPVRSNEDGSYITTRSIVEDGKTVNISLDAYINRYQLPTIFPLTHSIDNFIAANPLWGDYLEYSGIHHHSFAVIGVQKLAYIAEFAREQARITQGRDFTKEEIDAAAPVCVISESLAKINGLNIGDRIDMQYLLCDMNVPYQPYISQDDGTVMPSPYYYEANSELTSRVQYTIVGIYRQSEVWADVSENMYTVTTNTIFVPEKSIIGSVDYGHQGFFETIVLKNGAVPEFERIIMEHGFTPLYGQESLRDVFVYYDQGYSLVSASLMNYVDLARQVLAVGLVVYGIILGLFLLLYPLRQGKTLRIMANFGAPRKDKLAYVVVSSLGILLPGTVLGAALGATLWGVVIGRLLTVSSALFSLTLDFSTLALISLAQLVLAMLLVALLAIPMTRHCNLMKRK